ncbi:ABC transporter ATP-binding protein [Ichthyobacterium seriolicida]|uniref:ABC transporter ATP-binding protein n=1 Tax=Ichthyobacterium seriolicida TaxID=242600 RepID=A0A169Q3Z5_9FLAO|nr:ATP-binding cassette domain-containing protein [Ichthyobacterium seriolicida]BAU88532.1 ABC transporter ATP-binding protein [Ichthyobacterium seriolicida]BAV94967.1 phosphonate ABC transporter ATP-binding protein [Ichthyobacterium seriolicida]
MILVENLCKSFSDTEVLKDISLCLERGKVNFILGSSGSGKTVFIKSLLGLTEIDKGKVFYDGRSFHDLNIKEKQNLRMEIGMVFQGSALFDSYSVVENVIFPLKMYTDYSIEKMEDIAETVLKKVNLENIGNKYPSELSGGMKKRVAIARAIVMKPKYLFFDEPNSGLDPRTSIVIDELIQKITKEYNITTVANTHDMNSIMQIGDNIIFLKDGMKKWEGNKTDILHTNDKSILDFVFCSDLFKKIRSNI